MPGTPEQHATGYYVKMGDYRGRRARYGQRYIHCVPNGGMVRGIITAIKTVHKSQWY